MKWAWPGGLQSCSVVGAGRGEVVCGWGGVYPSIRSRHLLQSESSSAAALPHTEGAMVLKELGL